MEQNSPSETHSILIVGGGPVGLAAAIEFANHGIKTVLLEASENIVRESKAICWSQRTLEILDRSGTAASMLCKGAVWKTGRVFRGEKELYNFNLQEELGYKMPAFINLQQYYAEEFLEKKIINLNLTDLRRGHTVTDISITEDDRALVTVQYRGGNYCIGADYVLAADGVRSSIRSILDLEMKGQYFDEKFLITDVRVDGDFPLERRFWFEPSFHKGQSALLHVQPDNILRIDLQLGPKANQEEEQSEERVRARIQKILGSGIEFKIEWISIYSFSCKKLERFTHGPIFFVGDSAHVVSPFGARGANGGIQDIDNLIWKISLVIDGKAPLALLNSFDEERVPAAKENLLNSARSTDFMTPKTQASRDFRDAVFSLAQTMPFARSFINSGRLSTPFNYVGSSICFEDDFLFNDDGIVPGAAAVDAPVFCDEEETWLLENIGGAFCLIAFTKDISTLKLATDIIRKTQSNFEMLVKSVFVISSRTDIKYSGKVLEDRAGYAFRRWAADNGTIYLVRPDQHIAARWLRLPDADRVSQAFKQSIGY